jgi:hypothetical protein
LEKLARIKCLCLQVLIYTTFLASASISLHTVYAAGTTVRVDSSSNTAYKGDSFYANVTLQCVSNLYGWEFRLYWNNTVLNCTQADIYLPAIWFTGDSNLTFPVGPGLQNTYNATHGRYVKGIAASWPAPSFNGSMILVTFTFRALAEGNTVLALQNVNLATPIAHSIPATVFGGNVTVLPPPLFMRSDQHTVNNATMYKLMENHTQIARPVNSSVTDPENEAYCYWGVRVWKRSSAGTETEITSGSPVAVVSRTTSGSGLQSANWTCPATNLSTTDCLVVRVYYKFDWTSYSQCAEFMSLQLNATSLAGQTWTVHYYTQRSYSPSTHKTYMYYHWDNNYNSRIENVNYY